MAKKLPAYEPGTPIQIMPGVTHAEADFFAQEQQKRGFVGQMVDGDSAVGRRNGARPRFSAQPQGEPPFASIRKGRE